MDILEFERCKTVCPDVLFTDLYDHCDALAKKASHACASTKKRVGNRNIWWLPAINLWYLFVASFAIFCNVLFLVQKVLKALFRMKAIHKLLLCLILLMKLWKVALRMKADILIITSVKTD